MTTDVSIRRREYREMDLRGVTVIEAIPTMGLPAAIAGTHLVGTLGLEHVCGFESDAFPPVILVWNGKPRSPLRVYADGARSLAVVACEFTPEPALFRPIARAILAWARDVGAARILSPDAVAPLDDAFKPDKPRLVGAGTSEGVREALRKADVPLLDRGMLSGVSAMLMTEAPAGMDVATVGVEVSPEPDERLHDVHAAAALIDVLARLHPRKGIESKALHRKAAEAERLLRGLREKAAKAARREDRFSYAYH